MTRVVKRFPRRALTDLLERITEHVRLYECQVSLEFDGRDYRVSVIGDGTPAFGANGSDEEITLS